MEPWRASTRLPMMLDALGRPEQDAAVRRVTDALGGAPVAVRERLIGEPPLRSRRLLFASGGEVILHDDAVAAVLLHLEAPAPGARGVDLSEWIGGAGNDATLDDLKSAIGAPRHFAGFGAPYFTLDGGYARAVFRDDRGWNDAGNLRSIIVTSGKPGLTLRPEADDCAACSRLLVRSSEPDGPVDIDGTIRSLSGAVAAGALTEDAHWVPLADLRALHASGLLALVESQLTCTTCRRVMCFTLKRDSAPKFAYVTLNDARQRPLQLIPPVEQWGDAQRIAHELDAMHYVDHEPAAWFLVEQQGELYLQARYVITSMIDDSALIRLDGSEVEEYRARGHAFVSELARRIHEGSPHRETSPYFERDLFRGPEGRSRRDEVTRAIVNHTWIAQQRQAT